MRKLSALALAGLLAAPAAYAADIQFGGDVDAEYFNVRDASDTHHDGFRQRIRLQSVMDAGNGVQLHTRLNLFNDRWTGDASGVSIAGDSGTDDERPFSTRNHRNVELDYGFVQMPVGPGTLRVGRQMANWNHNFTTSDDRRDRILYLSRLGGQTVLVGADRRQDTTTGAREDDGNLFYAASLGAIGDTGWNYGVLAAYFTAGASNGTYALRGAKLLSPYVAGSVGPMDLTLGGHYLGDSRGAVFTENTYGVFLKGGFDANENTRLEAQVVYTDGGNLVAGGFDSYSMLIHNSLDHSASATRIGALNLGGLGTEGEEDDNVLLLGVRAKLAVTPDLTLTPALGWVNYDKPSMLDPDGDELDEDVLFLDLRADFQLNPATNLYAQIGYADTEDMVGNNTSGFVTGMNVRF
ncbi:MAG: hypothetical protein JJT90_17195 [Ectothiorhodospiraceae bacterium]|nr:hypothetical protein [Ectothiorhodospiraceae bacterium]